ncbi:MAG TPA: hypothetical protein PLC77_03355 [Bacteroidales bacterium]|nr:hypothetical protein [Bacteroidales bacterium]
MKQILIVLAGALLLAGCNRMEAPRKVAQEFLTCFFASDFKGAREYAAPELFGVLDQSAAILDSLTDEEALEVKNYLSTVGIEVDIPEEMEGDTVRIRYRVDFDKLPEPGESVIALRKEGRSWKVFSLE